MRQDPKWKLGAARSHLQGYDEHEGVEAAANKEESQGGGYVPNSRAAEQCRGRGGLERPHLTEGPSRLSEATIDRLLVEGRLVKVSR